MENWKIMRAVLHLSMPDCGATVGVYRPTRRASVCWYQSLTPCTTSYGVNGQCRTSIKAPVFTPVHSPDIKGIPVPRNVTISVCDHTAVLKSPSADTTVNKARTTTAHCPLCCDYGHGIAPGPVLYRRPHTASLCNTCFLHPTPRNGIARLARPTDVNMPSPVDHFALASNAITNLRYAIKMMMMKKCCQPVQFACVVRVQYVEPSKSIICL